MWQGMLLALIVSMSGLVLLGQTEAQTIDEVIKQAGEQSGELLFIFKKMIIIFNRIMLDKNM